MKDLASIIESDVNAALAEDVGGCDYTALLVAPDARATAHLLCRGSATVCGIPWFEACFRKLDPAVALEWFVQEGSLAAAGQRLCTVRGSARALLTGERTALNFLQLLSAVATKTRRFMTAVAGTRAKIVDTRKTLPGLRMAQKYAVRVGGGVNHRFGLYDAILIKENHIHAAGGVAAALEQAARVAPPQVWVQVEVETLAQLEEALRAGARMVLLDNMDVATMRRAVELANGRAELEASGGITLDTIRAIAETGVDRISIGSLTKDVKAVDLSLRFE
jgi:nicotinate-nucleotide pyrophosphorylase (carboxylating)